MRNCLIFQINNLEIFTENISLLVDEYEYGVVLRGGDIGCIPNTDISTKFDLAVGLGTLSICKPKNSYFDSFAEYAKKVNDWLFGFFSYDLKNELELLTSSNIDSLEFPELFFFQPELVLILNHDKLNILYHDGVTSKANIYRLVEDLQKERRPDLTNYNNIKFKSRFTKDEYVNTVNEIKSHIARGDIYEMNLCQEFYSANTQINPASTFNKLYSFSPVPFGAFFKYQNKFLISASPERYLRKEKDSIISQPIKGTSPRKFDFDEDMKSKTELANDPKERSENIMIVDLVRNDLSRIAISGSVTVNELCGVYSFKTVHQMISTVLCKIPPNINFVEAIKATFPMGSMTGAPKVRAMQLIEEFERTKRGLYSGAVGYVTPDFDFDFNVVIRSLLYNKDNGYLSFTVGSAITFKSEPEKEYAECLLKAKAILSTLNATINNAE